MQMDAWAIVASFSSRYVVRSAVRADCAGDDSSYAGAIGKLLFSMDSKSRSLQGFRDLAML